MGGLHYLPSKSPFDELNAQYDPRLSLNCQLRTLLLYLRHCRLRSVSLALMRLRVWQKVKESPDDRNRLQTRDLFSAYRIDWNEIECCYVELEVAEWFQLMLVSVKLIRWLLVCITKLTLHSFPMNYQIYFAAQANESIGNGVKTSVFIKDFIQTQLLNRRTGKNVRNVRNCCEVQRTTTEMNQWFQSTDLPWPNFSLSTS